MPAVGSAAIQLAKLVDCSVYATASTDRKREFTREIGADGAMHYSDISREFDDDLDLVLDGVGGKAFKRSLRSLGPGGRIITYGMASGDIPTVATPRLLFRNRSVIGYHLEHAFATLRDRVESGLEAVVEAGERGDVEVFVDRTFPLADATDAHRYVESRDSIGKVVLTVDG